MNIHHQDESVKYDGGRWLWTAYDGLSINPIEENISFNLGGTKKTPDIIEGKTDFIPLYIGS